MCMTQTSSTGYNCCNEPPVSLSTAVYIVAALCFIYVACSKSIRCDFFPRKVKHGTFAVVGRWRVPSCAYVDFFPPADSISHVKPACE
jgi:hypothetical protein